jgi:hypothetical protein
LEEVFVGFAGVFSRRVAEAHDGKADVYAAVLLRAEFAEAIRLN